MRYDEPPWAAEDWPYENDYDQYWEERDMRTYCTEHGVYDCANPHDVPEPTTVIEHEVVTGLPSYYIEDCYVGNSQESALTYLQQFLAVDRDNVDRRIRIEIIAPERETIQLWPVDEVTTDQTRSYIVTVYLHAQKMREAGFKINAIKYYRQVTGAGLKESKDTIEQDDIVRLGNMQLGLACVLDDVLQKHHIVSESVGTRLGPVLYAQRP